MALLDNKNELDIFRRRNYVMKKVMLYCLILDYIENSY